MQKNGIKPSLAVVGVALAAALLGGCASTSDLARTTATADHASQQAQAAQNEAAQASKSADQANQTANAAMNKADHASSVAEQAMNEVDRLKQEIDRMFKKTMQK